MKYMHKSQVESRFSEVKRVVGVTLHEKNKRYNLQSDKVSRGWLFLYSS